MYKRIILFLVLSLVITGCQSNQTANPDDVLKMTQNQERRIGVLQSLGGAYTSTQATHLLRMEDGNNIYLKSEKISLGDEKYLNTEVEVMGQIVRTTDKKQVMTVNSIDVLDVESTSADDLPQWVDYDSSLLELSLKYRDDYELTEKNEEITIEKASHPDEIGSITNEDEVDTSSDLEVATISIKKLGSDPSQLPTFMEVDSLSSADILAGEFTRSKVTQKAIEAYKKTVSNNDEIYYYLKLQSGAYVISFESGDNLDDLVAEQNMFYDILASIDFSSDPVDDDSEKADDAFSKDIEDNDIFKETLDFEEEEEVPVDSPEDEEIMDEAEIDDTISAESQGDEITGFSTFASESAGFTIQYPKSYYFGSTALSSNAYRSYEFGGEPLENAPGDILLDLMRGDVPEGKETSYGGIKMTSVDEGSIISVYVDKNGDVFKLTGPSGKEGVLKQMAATIITD